MHRTVEREQNLCRSAEVNGTKPKSLRCGRVKLLTDDKKSRARNSQSLFMGVLSDDFATVDVCEVLCYHSRPKEAKFRRLKAVNASKFGHKNYMANNKENKR